MKKFLLILALLVLVPTAFAPPAQASIWNDIKHDWNKVKHWAEKMTDKVEKAVKSGIHELDKLSKDVYKFVKKKLEKLLNALIRKLEGADGYKPKKFDHHAKHNGSGKITVIATNHAKITAIGGLAVDLTVGWKGISHTFHVNLGGNNRINYNSVVFPSANIKGWDIYIDSETNGTHHYVGIDVNVASVIL